MLLNVHICHKLVDAVIYKYPDSPSWTLKIHCAECDTTRNTRNRETDAEDRSDLTIYLQQWRFKAGNPTQEVEEKSRINKNTEMKLPGKVSRNAWSYIQKEG